MIYAFFFFMYPELQYITRFEKSREGCHAHYLFLCHRHICFTFTQRQIQIHYMYKKINKYVKKNVCCINTQQTECFTFKRIYNLWPVYNYTVDAFTLDAVCIKFVVQVRRASLVGKLVNCVNSSLPSATLLPWVIDGVTYTAV